MERETNRNSTETAKEGIAVECILIVAHFCTAIYIFFARWSFDGIQIHSLHPYEKHGIDQYRFFASTSKLIYAMKTTNSWRNLYLSKMLLSKAVCLSDFIVICRHNFCASLKSVSRQNLLSNCAYLQQNWINNGPKNKNNNRMTTTWHNKINSWTKTRIRRCVHSTKKKKTTHNIQPIWICQCGTCFASARASLSGWKGSEASHAQEWTIFTSPYHIYRFDRINNNKYAENVCYQIYFSLFIISSLLPKKKRTTMRLGPFQLRFSITHCSNFPLPECMARIDSVFRTLTALHYFLLKNKFAQKRTVYTDTRIYCWTIHEWCVYFYASHCAFSSSSSSSSAALIRFFSHTLSRSSQRERGRESLINFHKWWTVVNCSLFSFMCMYSFVCTNTFTHMHACFNARLMNRSHLCSLTQTHTMWTEITVCCKKIFVFIGISHSLSHNRLQFGRVK